MGVDNHSDAGRRLLNWILASNASGWEKQIRVVLLHAATNHTESYITLSLLTRKNQHPVLMQLTDGAPQSCAQSIPAGLTSDGSGILVTGTWTPPYQNFTVTLKDGTVVYNGGPTWKDNNGNEMSAAADMLNRDPLTVYNAPNKNYTSPLGNNVAGPSYTTWSYTDSNGSSRSFTLNYEAIDINTTSLTPLSGKPPVGSTLQFTGTYVVPYTLTLPGNGGVYTFGWENDDTGELTSVGLPSGGSIAYTYEVGPPTTTETANLKNCASGLGGCTSIMIERNEVTSRAVTDNSGTHTWNYTWSSVGTVTDPLGNQEIHTYSAIQVNPNNPDCPSQCSSTSYETEVQYENPSGTVLRTITKTYAADIIGVIGGAAGNNWGGVGNVRLTSETTTLNDVTPNLVKQVNTTYEIISNNYIAPGTTYNATWLNPTSVSESDWGSGSPGPVLRYTTYTYLHDPTNNPSGYTNYLSRNIADRVLVKSVYDSTASTCQGVSQPCAMITNQYDTTTLQASNAVQHDNTNYSTSFIYRGNLTALSHWLNTTGSSLTTTSQYDDAGGLLSVTDPLNNTTTFSRTDSWNNATCAPSGQGKAYITSSTNALNQITTNTFNSCTGMRASTTDPNSQTTNFTYDFSDRLTLTSFPLVNGQHPTVATTYNDVAPISTTTTTTITSSLNGVSTTLKDYLGRVSETQLTSDPEGTDYTDTTYDAVGRTARFRIPIARCASRTATRQMESLLPNTTR